jgi:hypothetical protein
LTKGIVNVDWLQKGGYLSNYPKEILEAIEKSRSMLDMEDNCDGEGCIATKEDVWNRATQLLSRISSSIYDGFGFSILAPHISCDVMGGVDFHWKHEKFELLVDVLKKEDYTASFYGDNYGDIKIEGKIT